MALSLHDLLKIWQHHADLDVEPQSATRDHLEIRTLQRLVQPGGIKSGAGADLEHLSSCPACFRAWAKLCRGEAVAQLDEETPASRFFFGHQPDDDVFGQDGRQTLLSHCRRFSLRVTLPAEAPQMQRLDLSTPESRFHGSDIRVRDRNGQLILAGVLSASGLSTLLPRESELDLSLWTIVVRFASGADPGMRTGSSA